MIFQAIKERRKSALKMPDMFFGGQAPGMNAINSRLSGVFPPMTSPERKLAVVEDENGDTSTLLAKMKETIADMKNNKSLLPEELSSGSVENEKGMDMAVRLSLSTKKREMEWGKSVLRAESQDIEDGDKGVGGSNEVAKLAPMKTNDENANFKDVSTAPAATTVQGSPLLKGIKDLFRPAPPPSETPKLDGVKAMFQREKEKAVGTPTFEGLLTMLQTPVRYQRDNDRRDESGEATDEATDEEENPLFVANESRGETSPSEATSSSTTKVPSSATSRSTSPRMDDNQTIADNDFPKAVTNTQGKAKTQAAAPPQPKARLLRSKKPVEASTEVSLDGNAGKNSFLR